MSLRHKFNPAKRTHFAVEAGRAAVVAALCATMVAPEAFAAAPAAADVPKIAHTAPLTQDEKVLHALNRLTFGPRPGDAKAAEAMGLDAWFDRQLHPETIDDSALDRRLDQFPALRLSQAEMVKRFPSPLFIRYMDDRHVKLPADPAEHAIFADNLERYHDTLKAEADAAGTGAPAGPYKGGMPPMVGGVVPGGSMDGMGMGDSAMDGGQAAAAGQGMDGAQTFRKKGAKKAGPDIDGSMSDTKSVSAGAAPRAKNPMSADAMNEIFSLSPDDRMAKLEAFDSHDLDRFYRSMKFGDGQRLVAGLSPKQVEVLSAMQSPIRVVASETLQERFLRDVFSERQVQAVMSDFWLNHFSVYAKKSQFEPYYLESYQRDAILPNALGKFEDLLLATARSAAMQVYLDNWESVGPNSPAAARAAKIEAQYPNAPKQKLGRDINENYAREIMELHTLGVDGGYTQKDIIEVAKCFTGWGIQGPYKGGEFEFDPERHEPGAKVVLGKTIPEGGEQEGLTVIHMLATSPATAHFISKKLAVRFVSDNPPDALVNRMAATFLKTGGDIKSVLSTMFHSPEFWTPDVYRAKVKTPIEFVASAVRASNATVDHPILLVQALERLGMPIYGMQTPNGYSWQSEDWVSTGALVTRMNFALVLSGDKLRGTETNWPQLLGDKADPSGATLPSVADERALEILILGEPASSHTRSTVLEQAKNPDAQKIAAKGFAAAAPEGMAGGGMSPDSVTGDDVMMTLKSSTKGYTAGAGSSFDSGAPETPLDTMAGLLLGSPDFQRR